MLLVGKDLASYTLAAGEPFVLEVQLLDSAGRATDLDDQAMVLTFYTAGTRALVTDYAGAPSQYEGERLSDTTGEYFRWAFDGRWSEAMLSKPGLRVELAQRLFYGRSIISTGTLSVINSSAVVPSLAGGSIALTAVRVSIKANATLGGAPQITQTVILYDGPSVPIPAPVFTTPSSIASDGTPQVGELLTGIDGVATNAASYTRRWLLGSTLLTSSATYTPTAAGSYRYETVATGPGGETTSGSNITVAAATVPAPTLSQPSISPTSAPVGTTFTATDGTVTNGTITGRRWLLGTTAIGTGTTVTPNAAGSLTLENTATGTNGAVITSTSPAVTVSAATVTPTLALSPTSPSIASNAAGGTLVSNISNVPAGVSPSVTPNDGRLVIAGSASAGWKVVVGMSALSAGTINFSVAATGATGANGVLTVAAATASAFTYGTDNNRVINNVESRGRVGRVDYWRHTLVYAAKRVVFSWNGWRISNGGSYLALPNAVPIRTAKIVCNGIVKMVAWPSAGNAGSLTLQPGDNDIRCQVLVPSDFGLTEFPAGTVFETGTDVILDTTAQSIPVTERQRTEYAGQQTTFYDPSVTTLGNTTGTGAYTLTGTAGDVRVGGMVPICLIEPVNPATAIAWLSRGDSITMNVNDGGNKLGWFIRACRLNGVASMNMAVTATESTSGVNAPNVDYWYQFASRFILFYGTNDFGQAVSASFDYAALENRLNGIMAQMRTRSPGCKIGMPLYLPRAASTDQWVTEENQTYNTGWVSGGKPDIVNKNIIAGVDSVNGITITRDFVIPFNSIRGTDPFKWKVNGTANGFASDETHPSTGGHVAMAAEAAPLMAAA